MRVRGVNLAADLPAVVEAVIKPLDPSVPSLREGCLGASTSALRELVKRYPMMAFSQGTQRLAVGTIDGVVLIYDLRTATKWRILQVRVRTRVPNLPLPLPLALTTKWRLLQGHEQPVSALAFSGAGDQVASFSSGDGTLRWWQAGSSGLFSFLGLQGSCIHVTRTGHTPPPGSLLQIEWTSASAVSLSCNKVARSLSPPLSLSLRLILHLTLSLPLNLILILTLTRLPSASTARDEESRPFPFENKARMQMS